MTYHHINIDKITIIESYVKQGLLFLKFQEKQEDHAKQYTTLEIL